MAPQTPLDTLAKQVGQFIEYWGFKEIHGRIWTHLFLSDGPLDAGALINRLDVSKALISLSLKDLLHYKVIVVAGKSDHGTILYDINPEIGEVIANVLKTREHVMISSLSGTYKKLRDDRKLADVDGARLKELGKLIENAQTGLQALMQLHAFNLLNFSVKNSKR